jgi:LPXTG-motif cell wall-anchored protein
MLSEWTTWLSWAGAALAIGLLVWLWRTRRPSPEEQERRRRLTIYRQGRLIEAVVTDLEANLVHYCYEIRGIRYTASQDVTSFAGGLAENVIGAASCKYQLDNPANSIVICEDWSGLRSVSQPTERTNP